MEFLWIFLIIIVVGVIVGIKKMNENEKTWKNEKEQFNITVDALVEYNFNNTVESDFCSYKVGKDNHIHLLIMKKGQTRQASVPFNEIIDCKIYKDDEVLGGVGRAIVGGVLAGGVGAIVGSTTARKKVTNYKVAIIRNNIAEPLTEILLIDKETKTDNIAYKQADEFATKVYASVMAIIANNQK